MRSGGSRSGGAAAPRRQRPSDQTRSEVLQSPLDVVSLHRSSQQRQRAIQGDAISVNLILVRHGYSEANDDWTKAAFISDPLLVERYANSQSPWAGELIKRECLEEDIPTIIVSSNLIRAMMTASFLSKKINTELPIYVSPHLKEHLNLGQSKAGLRGGNTTLLSPDYQLHKILKGYDGFNQEFLFDGEFFKYINQKIKVMEQIKRLKRQADELRRTASRVAGTAGGGAAAGFLGAGFGYFAAPLVTDFIKRFSYQDGDPYQDVIKRRYDPKQFTKDCPIGDFKSIHFRKDAEKWPALLYKKEFQTENGELDIFFTNAVCRLLRNALPDGVRRCNLIIVCHGGVIRQFLHQHGYISGTELHIGNCDVFHIKDSHIMCTGDSGRLRLGTVCDWYQNPFQEKIKQRAPLKFEQDQQFQIVPSSRSHPSQAQDTQKMIKQIKRQQLLSDDALHGFDLEQLIGIKTCIQEIMSKRYSTIEEKKFVLEIIRRFIKEKHVVLPLEYAHIISIIHKLYMCGYTSYTKVNNFFKKYNLFDIFRYKMIKMNADEKQMKQMLFSQMDISSSTRDKSIHIIQIFSDIFTSLPCEKLSRILLTEQSKRFYTMFEKLLDEH
jgi:broad specificity phosphatase PhoE